MFDPPPSSSIQTIRNRDYDTGRIRQSCEVCRVGHHRCSGQPEGCERCQQMYRTCVYNGQRRRGRKPSRADTWQIPSAESGSQETPTTILVASGSASTLITPPFLAPRPIPVIKAPQPRPMSTAPQPRPMSTAPHPNPIIKQVKNPTDLFERFEGQTIQFALLALDANRRERHARFVNPSAPNIPFLYNDWPKALCFVVDRHDTVSTWDRLSVALVRSLTLNEPLPGPPQHLKERNWLEEQELIIHPFRMTREQFPTNALMALSEIWISSCPWSIVIDKQMYDEDLISSTYDVAFLAAMLGRVKNALDAMMELPAVAPHVPLWPAGLPHDTNLLISEAESHLLSRTFTESEITPSLVQSLTLLASHDAFGLRQGAFIAPQIAKIALSIGRRILLRGRRLDDLRIRRGARRYLVETELMINCVHFLFALIAWYTDNEAENPIGPFDTHALDDIPPPSFETIGSSQIWNSRYVGFAAFMRIFRILLDTANQGQSSNSPLPIDPTPTQAWKRLDPARRDAAVHYLIEAARSLQKFDRIISYPYEGNYNTFISKEATPGQTSFLSLLYAIMALYHLQPFEDPLVEQIQSDRAAHLVLSVLNLLTETYRISLQSSIFDPEIFLLHQGLIRVLESSSAAGCRQIGAADVATIAIEKERIDKTFEALLKLQDQLKDQPRSKEVEIDGFETELLVKWLNKGATYYQMPQRF